MRLSPACLLSLREPCPSRRARSVGSTPPDSDARYIVMLKDIVVNPRTRALALTTQYGKITHHIFENALRGFATTLSPAAVAVLRSLSDVAYIELDRKAVSHRRMLVPGDEWQISIAWSGEGDSGGAVPAGRYRIVGWVYGSIAEVASPPRTARVVSDVLPQLKCDSHCLHSMQESLGGVHESKQRQEEGTAAVHAGGEGDHSATPSRRQGRGLGPV